MFKKFWEWLKAIFATIDLSIPAPPTPEVPVEKSVEAKPAPVILMKKGDLNAKVKKLQEDLNRLGHDVGNVDSDFGKNTEAGVKAFQKASGLPVTGQVDQATLDAVAAAIAKLPPKPVSKIPTRDEMLKVLVGMCEGTIPTNVGPYKLIRETKGKNRSPEIDKLIKAQGGSLAEPYCQYGQQEMLDELCRYYKLDRKLVQIPEGGSTQTVWSLVPKQYKLEEPGVLCWVTWRHGTSYQGHVEMCLTEAVKGKYKTFGFNTTVDGDDKVVRDGQGAGYMDRRTGTIGDMNVKGYTDVYQAIVDAMEREA